MQSRYNLLLPTRRMNRLSVTNIYLTLASLMNPFLRKLTYDEPGIVPDSRLRLGMVRRDVLSLERQLVA